MTSAAATPTVTFAVARATDPASDGRRAELLANPGFGRVFTDHMVTLRWSLEQGWHDGRLAAYTALRFDPAVMALHYGQSIFEGLKAYRQPDGGVATFRPWMNAQRFERSAVRMAMPVLPDGVFLEAVELLVREDREWVPTAEGHTLYVRPFMFASEVGLGVRPSAEHLFVVIASPSASYFPRGVKPVTVWLSEDYVRAAPGGTGEAKCAGNYGASLIAQQQAIAEGCDQVVWLDAVEHRWVEEMGGMNLFFVYGEGESARLVTPSLTGTLLAGVTRDALLTLAKGMGYAAEEGRISVDDWREGNADGSISEVFACGTAAVITPVGEVKHAAGSWEVGDGEPGPVTMRLRRALLDIQHGQAADEHGWVHRIC
jgi:branched-chain amino acid aminotransferase